MDIKLPTPLSPVTLCTKLQRGHFRLVKAGCTGNPGVVGRVLARSRWNSPTPETPHDNRPPNHPGTQFWQAVLPPEGHPKFGAANWAAVNQKSPQVADCTILQIGTNPMHLTTKRKSTFGHPSKSEQPPRRHQNHTWSYL